MVLPTNGRLCCVNNPTIYPLGAETVLAGRNYCAKTGETLTLCTTQFESNLPATISLTGIIAGTDKYNGDVVITGSGNVVFASGSKSSRAIAVGGDATLSINSGADITNSTVSVDAGATLEVAGSGTVTLGGLVLADGACLGFHFTERDTMPALALFNSAVPTVNGAVTVKISGDSELWPKSGIKALTTCGGFGSVSMALSTPMPKWVKTGTLSVNDDGNIAVEIKPKGLVIFFL